MPDTPPPDDAFAPAYALAPDNEPAPLNEPAPADEPSSEAPMTGHPPVPTITGTLASYAAGTPVELTLTVNDPDNRVETTDTSGPASNGTTVYVHEVRRYVDKASVTAAWYPLDHPAITVTALDDQNFRISTEAPAGGGALLITVTDGQGHHVPTRVPIAVATTMLVGVDANPAEHATHLALYPGARVISAFASPGNGLPRPPAGLPNGVILHQRFKDPVSAALVNPWLDAIDRPTWLTWHHEPRTTDDPVAHKRAHVALRQLVDAHPNGRLVTLVGNFMLYQVREAGMRWQNYWALMSDGTPANHAIGFDCYVNEAKPTLEAADSFFAVPLAAARAAGVPLSISELGAVITAAAGRAAGPRADWIRECVAHLRGQPEVRAVCWWCNTGSQGDFHLDHDPAALQVWREACAQG